MTNIMALKNAGNIRLITDFQYMIEDWASICVWEEPRQTAKITT